MKNGSLVSRGKKRMPWDRKKPTSWYGSGSLVDPRTQGRARNPNRSY
jgi:hypothetical protein